MKNSDVLVTVSGFQIEDSDKDSKEKIELITNGKYFCKDGKHYILYDEFSSPEGTVTKNMIKLIDNRMEVTKKGESSYSLVFEENKKTLSFYQLPFGKIMIGIYANNISVVDKDNKMNISVRYDMDIDDGYKKYCEMNINVKALKKDCI